MELVEPTLEPKNQQKQGTTSISLINVQVPAATIQDTDRRRPEIMLASTVGICPMQELERLFDQRLNPPYESCSITALIAESTKNISGDDFFFAVGAMHQTLKCSPKLPAAPDDTAELPAWAKASNWRCVLCGDA
jgi:hypothetical protein